MICQSYFLVMLLINYQSFTNLIYTNLLPVTNTIFMLLSLLIVYQSFANPPHRFITLPNVLPIITDLTQCYITS